MISHSLMCTCSFNNQ